MATEQEGLFQIMIIFVQTRTTVILIFPGTEATLDGLLTKKSLSVCVCVFGLSVIFE